MKNGFTVHIPAAVSAWLQQEQRDVSQVESVGIESELRLLTQEETKFSHFRDYAETGLHTVTLTLRDGTILQKDFTSGELRDGETEQNGLREAKR